MRRIDGVVVTVLAEIESSAGGFDDSHDLGGLTVPWSYCRRQKVSLLTFLSTMTTFGTTIDLVAAGLPSRAFCPPTGRRPPRSGETLRRSLRTPISMSGRSTTDSLWQFAGSVPSAASPAARRRLRR